MAAASGVDGSQQRYKGGTGAPEARGGSAVAGDRPLQDVRAAGGRRYPLDPDRGEIRARAARRAARLDRGAHDSRRARRRQRQRRGGCACGMTDLGSASAVAAHGRCASKRRCRRLATGGGGIRSLQTDRSPGPHLVATFVRLHHPKNIRGRAHTRTASLSPVLIPSKGRPQPPFAAYGAIIGRGHRPWLQRVSG